MTMLLAFLFPIFSGAEQNYKCEIKEVINSGYEELYDFSFSDYPNLSFSISDAGMYSVSIGAMTYDETSDELVEIKKFGTKEKYTVFYDGYLTETVEFKKSTTGNMSALLRAILDETDEIYDIAYFDCK